MATDSPRDPQDVGYTLPAILAVAVHALVVVLSLISLPTSTAEPDSSSIVQATLVGTETFTDQAQQVTEQQAAMNRAAEPEVADPTPEPEPPATDTSQQEAQQQAAEEAAQREAQQEEEQRALEEAQARAEEEADRKSVV